MSQLAPTTQKILDGKVLIFRRPRSSFWQAKYRINGQSVRISTKTDDYLKAVEIATDAYGKARWGAELGVPVITRTFKSVADLVAKELQTALDGGYGKITFISYITAIKNYLIPFFGNRSITKIDGPAMQEFAQWRKAQMKKTPSHTLVNTHNVALTRVLDAALARGFINQTQVPKLFNDGNATERRPDFTKDEFIKLQEEMKTWIKQGKQGKITQKREILRDYVQFVAYTGCRPGTETQGLKWKHIRFADIGRVAYVLITVTGKTGTREIVAHHSIVRPLTRLLQRQTAFKGLMLGEALERKLDAYVFALPDGEEVKNLLRPFEILLTETGLLVDPRVNENRTLYSLRHVYITRALTNGTPAAKVAKQCGTSIAMIDKHYSHINALTSARSLVLGER